MELNSIHNIDCVQGMQKLPSESIDLTVTSPPYDNLRTYNGFAWDFEAVAKELYRVTKQGGGKSSVDVREGKSPTLTTTHDGAPAVCYTIDEKCANTYVWREQANTLAARDYKQPQTVVQALGFDPPASRDVGQYFLKEKGNVLTNGTCPGHHNGVCIRQGTRYIVRRLTPMECERLQGYPDGWTDIGEWKDSKGKVHKTSDASRYKALGNSIALPPWKWVLKRICACYERDATMASLFDGIGGFPYLWEQLNGKGTCLWASEIEEFPMAVTKVRIGE